jgi:hypothetical protein
VAQLQLDPGTATAAPESSTRTEPSDVEPAPAAAATEPSAPEEPAPPELAPEADATLPDLPPPELRQDEAEAGGGEQVEAPMPLLLMAQVSVYPPAASYRGLGAMY